MDRPTERWWSPGGMLALVTGSNRGIGLEIVRQLAQLGVTTILTSRDEIRGRKAAQHLLDSEGLRVDYHQLDVSCTQSVLSLKAWLSQEYGKLDILVNNAAIDSSPNNPAISHLSRIDGAKAVINTNYYGAKRMIDSLLPLIPPNGRIVNVSSAWGGLKFLKNEWRAKLEDTAAITNETVEAFLADYLQAVEQGKPGEEGWPVYPILALDAPEDQAPYGVAKMAMGAYTRMLSKEEDLGKNKNTNKMKVYINCMCPGLTGTGMCTELDPEGLTNTPQVGAETAVKLALLRPSECPSGRFYVGGVDVGFTDVPCLFRGGLMSVEDASNQITAAFLRHNSQAAAV